MTKKKKALAIAAAIVVLAMVVTSFTLSVRSATSHTAHQPDLEAYALGGQIDALADRVDDLDMKLDELSAQISGLDRSDDILSELRQTREEIAWELSQIRAAVE